MKAELPGTTRDAITVEIVDGSLSINASRKEKSAEGENTVSFSRLVNVPDEECRPTRSLPPTRNGILTVTLPRKEEAKPRKINVSVN